MPMKVLSGARAKLMVVDPNTNSAQVVGIFTDCSYASQYDAQPVFILGRFSAAEIEYTGAEPISITCTGWRVINQGPHVSAKVPKLQDLLTHEYLSLALIDRETGATFATVTNVRPTGYSTTLSSRQLQQITVSFVGLLLSDESVTNAEAAGSTQLP